MKLVLLLISLLLTLGFAATQPYNKEKTFYWDPVPQATAALETEAVPSADDAADDAAIWINPADSSKSLILATDKQAGLLVFNMEGKTQQFLPLGRLNNVDLRQGLTLGAWQGDLAAASNIGAHSIDLFSVNASGVKSLASFPSQFPSPYGICTGEVEDGLLVFVTYKSGVLQIHKISGINNDQVEQQLLSSHHFSSALEGCDYNDATRQLFVGEEDVGVWRISIHQSLDTLVRLNPELIARVGENGIEDDVEGITLYNHSQQQWVVASSQGNSSYAIFSQTSGEFVGRFRVGRGEYSDGTQGTDGIAAVSHYINDHFPQGVLVVQDDNNTPKGSHQNFKLVDWREINLALELSE